METLGKYTIDNVLEMHDDWVVGIADKPAVYICNGVSYKVKRSSQRYSVFANSLSCFACDAKGEYFLLQRSPSDPPGKAHFNLYGEFLGEPILFTKDHIQPRSKGGKDRLENYHTMCLRCNMAKSDNEDLIRPLDILKHRFDYESKILETMANKMRNKDSDQLLIDKFNLLFSQLEELKKIISIVERDEYDK